jgi:eukaryotic-like serine/threonine-protein kinase
VSHDRFARLDELFQAALELPESQRDAYLSGSCGEDAALLAQARQLLEHHAAETTLLSDSRLHVSIPNAAFAAEAEEAVPIPTRIGRYEVLGVLGRGGMGVVYEARQDNPRRIVALKLIRSDLAGGGMLRRFQQEANVLAALQHPGIAHIYDAGVADGRYPYFAMELVRGLPLTDFAVRSGLSVRQRLALLAEVCDAVQHAHERGVIHRDLKPGNILVSDGATEQRSADGGTKTVAPPVFPAASPKILDFGVARVVNSDVRTLTLRTDVGQLIGTIPYMSPEQVSGDSARIDARSDVYALGVLLYELLAERLPLDVRRQPIPEAARIIRDEEPTRLSSLNPVFRGDIETIVAKAMEKDSSRRYPSAAALAADIRRYLRDEPIIARPATTGYQIRKFARRHRELVVGLAMTFLALLGGLPSAHTLCARPSCAAAPNATPPLSAVPPIAPASVPPPWPSPDTTSPPPVSRSNRRPPSCAAGNGGTSTAIWTTVSGPARV